MYYDISRIYALFFQDIDRLLPMDEDWIFFKEGTQSYWSLSSLNYGYNNGRQESVTVYLCNILDKNPELKELYQIRCDEIRSLVRNNAELFQNTADFFMPYEIDTIFDGIEQHPEDQVLPYDFLNEFYQLKREQKEIEKQLGLSGDKYHADFSSLLYQFSSPCPCNSLHQHINNVLGENCEIRVMKNPAELLQFSDKAEYDRLYSAFFGSPQGMEDEIRDFLNQCTFSGGFFDMFHPFKKQVTETFLSMARKSEIHKMQAFSLIALGKWRAKQQHRDVLMHFKKSNDGSAFDSLSSIPTMKVDFKQILDAGFNVLSKRSVSKDYDADILDVLYHEIGHFLYRSLWFGFYNNNDVFSIASLGRSVNTDQQEKERIQSEFQNLCKLYGEQKVTAILRKVTGNSYLTLSSFIAGFDSSGHYNEKVLFHHEMELLQILGFWVEPYQEKKIIYLNPNSDFCRSLATHQKIRIDHLGVLKPETKTLCNSKLIANVVRYISEDILSPFWRKKEHLDISFYRALALSFGYSQEALEECIS